MTISGRGFAALYAAMNAALDASISFLLASMNACFLSRAACSSGVSGARASAHCLNSLAFSLKVVVLVYTGVDIVSALLSHPILAKSISISFSNSVK